jgi:hypothetical protein
MAGFAFGKTKLGKIAYDVYVLCTDTTSIPTTDTSLNTWKKVGICGAEPIMKDGKGDTIKTNDGVDNVIARNQEVAFTVYEVTPANRSSLVGVINKVTSVVFAVKGGTAPTGTTLTAPAGGWLLQNVNVFPETNITGNGQNQIACTGMIEVGAGDTTNFTGVA